MCVHNCQCEWCLLHEMYMDPQFRPHIHALMEQFKLAKNTNYFPIDVIYFD